MSTVAKTNAESLSRHGLKTLALALTAFIGLAGAPNAPAALIANTALSAVDVTASAGDQTATASDSGLGDLAANATVDDTGDGGSNSALADASWSPLVDPTDGVTPAVYLGTATVNAVATDTENLGGTPGSASGDAGAFGVLELTNDGADAQEFKVHTTGNWFADIVLQDPLLDAASLLLQVDLSVVDALGTEIFQHIVLNELFLDPIAIDGVIDDLFAFVVDPGVYTLSLNVSALGDAFGTASVVGAVLAGFEVVVPEPASLALFALGLAGLGFMRRRAA